ncbi:MAG: heavy metal translocating P-type ATPase [Deltaproteobacteria bacterium]|nr:MAG: heavy metal translocating P-type ATPase [Deltaproteobacteria bacterium]
MGSTEETVNTSRAGLYIGRSILKRRGITVRQAMAGRIRVRIKALQRQERQCRWMQSHLSRLKGVSSVETRKATGSVIVYFDPLAQTLRSLLAVIIEQLEHPVQYSAPLEVIPGFQNFCDCCDEKPEASLRSKKRRVFWLTGVMGYAAVRLWLFSLPLVQAPLSIIGIAAVAGTIPLIGEAVRDTVEKKKVTVKPFLVLGTVSTIVMGQPFSALQLIWIYNVAELTEEYVAQRSRKAIRNILEIAPARAFILVEGMEVEVAVADIKKGDVVVVHTGEKIPVDGEVREGEAEVDESSINGRAETVLRQRGDSVHAGTIISQGILFINTERTGEDTYLAHIMKMVEDSLQNKAPVEQKADELAARLMKIGLAATALTFLVTLDPMRTLTVMLVMSCPCATVLAASSAITAAIANAAKHQILIKGGLYLENVGKADVYCLDKTGTLTTELPEIISITGRTPTLKEDTILGMAATAESHNQHPMAQAILAEAGARGLTPDAHAVCEFRAGRGVFCTVGGDSAIIVGNRQFMDEHQIDTAWFDKKADQLKEGGNTVVYVAKNGKAQGMIGVANPVRPETVRVLHCLRRDGVKGLHLVTGDHEEVAKSMMHLFPFDECRASLMPEEKAQWVGELKQSNSVVMVGDGINDALALVQADVGIAMGAGGAEVSMEAADIALADSNLEGLMRVRNLSHKTMRVIDQNHYLAVSTDLIGVALGMFGLLSPVMAGMIHILHTGGILLNSGRLLKWEPPVEPMDRCCRCRSQQGCSESSLHMTVSKEQAIDVHSVR